MGNWRVLGVAVVGLILTIVSVVVATAYLVGTDHQVPDGLIALGSAAVGALATLMTTQGHSEPINGKTPGL